MSNPGDADTTPIESVRELAEYFAAGCKPRDQWRIGTEHEKFGFRIDTHATPPYEPGGIRAMLEGLQAEGCWEPILDGANVIGLKGMAENHGASVSLEPAGQFELSGGPLETLHETRAELDRHFAAVGRVAGPLGLGFAPLGFHPTARAGEMPWMPKSRYAIMRRYMPTVGSRGLDMMQRTCTVQVNLDFSSEADMARKLRVSLALQPVATALFANSPFRDGAPNGLLSNRAEVWADVDRQRSGMPAVMFEDGFGFERHAEWLLDVPMYFIVRDDRLVDTAGLSFRRFVAGTEPALAHTRATIGDWADHVTTAFTDVRVKRYIEMRGADAGTPRMMVAQSALWVGLLYDDAALSAADSLVRQAPWADYAELRGAVPRAALDARFGRGTARDLARDMVSIAQDGLRARGRQQDGEDETGLLAPLLPIVAGGPVQAEHWLARYESAWGSNVQHIFAESAI